MLTLKVVLLHNYFTEFIFLVCMFYTCMGMSPVMGRDSTGSKVTKLTPSVACVDVMSGKLRGNFERERRACTHSA